MSSLFDPNNKQADHQLKQLMGDLPGMVRSMAKGRSRNSTEKGFKRFCPICCLLYDRAKLWWSGTVKETHCKGCQKMLDEGCTALITTSHRWAFMKIGEAQKQWFTKLKDDKANDLTDDDRVLLGKLVEMQPGKTITVSDDELTGALALAGQKGQEPPPTDAALQG